ncbi:Inherit from bactNOG: outer membrane autotransporter barrel (Partial), partial [Seminavis robusta]|eukprot:Sro4381_g353870.1 Inherit from bactNOG: outer membrane autotransporter barrel (352) ;mRNA; r:102-1327
MVFVDMMLFVLLVGCWCWPVVFAAHGDPLPPGIAQFLRTRRSEKSRHLRNGYVRLGDYAGIQGVVQSLTGYSLSMNAVGNMMAVGAPGEEGDFSFERGAVRVFEFASGTWTQKGQDIIGKLDDSESFGFAVWLSPDGQTLAASANSASHGYVQVYEINASGDTWIKRGVDLDELNPGEGFGRSIALSDDAVFMVVGAPFYDEGADTEVGRLYFFDYRDGSNYVLRTEQLVFSLVPLDRGQAATQQMGSAVAMSSDGKFVAVGSPFDQNDLEKGLVFVLSILWGFFVNLEVFGGVIEADESGTSFGLALAMNGDGTHLAVGSPFFDGLVDSAGRVQVFSRATEQGTSTWIQLG